MVAPPMGPPSAILGVRKLETLGYPIINSLYGIPVRSLVLTQYMSTDSGRIWHSIYSACKAICFAGERCENWTGNLGKRPVGYRL